MIHESVSTNRAYYYEPINEYDYRLLRSQHPATASLWRHCETTTAAVICQCHISFYIAQWSNDWL